MSALFKVKWLFFLISKRILIFLIFFQKINIVNIRNGPRTIRYISYRYSNYFFFHINLQSIELLSYWSSHLIYLLNSLKKKDNVIFPLYSILFFSPMYYKNYKFSTKPHQLTCLHSILLKIS